jgi:uncharacterized protein
LLAHLAFSEKNLLFGVMSDAVLSRFSAPVAEAAAPPTTPAASLRRADPRVVALALGLIGAGLWFAATVGGWRVAAAFGIAAIGGIALVQAGFGFAGGWRKALIERRTGLVRAQILMIGVTLLAFAPLLALGSVFGQPVRGYVFPISLDLVLGAALFGLGMAVTGACGSGTLFAAGAGSARMWIALPAFIAGATGAAFLHDHWAGLPRLAAVSLPAALGTVPALVLQIGALGLLWWGMLALERRRHGVAAPLAAVPGGRLLGGPWSPLVAALVLACVAVATLLIAGRPWGITQAFTLWGSWAIDGLGLEEPHFWSYWEEPTRVDFLHRRLFADTTSVMNLGLIAGAMLAAGVAGRFQPTLPTLSGAAGAIIGGLMLGAGAVIGTGCNISALFSGIASGSLHGWVWLAAAAAGNVVGNLALRRA